ncbi:hypothetical protein ACFFSY_22505 [Paenibacillus aurantiacus]|uniref:Uncharacterized protein n=1 Tax=Paenibacillus aurantiacus TaxID=1936118 RepID=A0ABV5KU25_9BACL
MGNKVIKIRNNDKQQKDPGGMSAASGNNLPDIIQFFGQLLVTTGDVITTFGQALAFEQAKQDQMQSDKEKQEQQLQQQEMQKQIEEMKQQINQLQRQLKKNSN